MKKTVSFIFLIVALSLAAENYRTLFNASIVDSKLEEADSILRQWTAATPDDPELFPANFNLLLLRARNQTLVLSKEPGQTEYELALSDSTGNSAGYMFAKTTWDEPLVDSAFFVIDRGIEAFPDRIDFRLGKAYAGKMTERWDTVINTVDGILDRDIANNGRWLSTLGDTLASADSLLASATFDYLSNIYSSKTEPAIEIKAALPLAEKAAKRFDNDVRLLNTAGTMYYNAGNTDAAMAYFEKAARVAAEDVIPLNNIAYLYYERGDTVKALEIYRKIENGNYDRNSREVASTMIKRLTTPAEEMEEYFYFFRYLPYIASDTKDLDEFLNVEMVNSVIAKYNHLKSPFADSAISAEKIKPKGDSPEVVVWTFPMPAMIPMCRYMAFVPDDKGGCSVYTLEKSLENRWVVGTQQGENHGNFGDIRYPKDAAAFVKALRKKKLL